MVVENEVVMTTRLEKKSLTKQNIIVAGYFDRHNLGDDLFAVIWKHIFSKDGLNNYKVKLIGLDDLRVCDDLRRCDVLIFGGGDVLNYYFLAELKNIIHKFEFKGKLYAFSVGIPYQVVIVDGLLDQFNFIMCRAKGDAFNLRRRFGESHVRYFPDLSVYLPELFKVQKSKKEFPGVNEYKVFNQKLNVGVFLTRTIFEKNPHYDSVVKKIARALDTISELDVPGICGFEIFLIPFNTNPRNPFENDRLINGDVMKHIKNGDAVHNVDRPFTVEEMWWTFKHQLDMCITMRYHSHMYAISAKVPLASLYTTRKVQNLLFDSNLTCYGYHFPLNEDDVPTDFDDAKFVTKFNTAFNDRNIIVNNMKSYQERYVSPEQFENTLQTLIEDPVEKVHIRARIYPLSTIVAVIESLVKYIWNEQNKMFTEQDVALVADEIYKGKVSFVTLLEDKKEQILGRGKMADFLAALACFGLIQIPYPKYHYGMSKKILKSNFHAKNEFMWVWQDHQKGNEKFFLENLIIRKPYFNATFVGIEDFRGCHRSGWQYVLDNLMGFHSDTSSFIFDNYVDRTFHWAHDVYKYTKIIPFKKPWCGFVHHTFDESYSSYNVPSLFRKETFRQSLKYCHALFTLSQDLAVKIRVLLQQYGFKEVYVKAFVHPTETSTVMFSLDRFKENTVRKVVHIGAWMRNTYAIYELGQHKSKHMPYETERTTLRKAILKGKHMDSYFKPENFVLVYDTSFTEGNKYEYDFQSRSRLTITTQNKFVTGLAQHVHESWISVEIIETLSDEEYDQLLSENIVFLNLVDASAVNTVVECIVRCTPILVNRLAAVEEMLGADYPFYYETMTEAALKVNDVMLIEKTNNYLVAMNKQRFTMDYFMHEMDDWFNEHTNDVTL